MSQKWESYGVGGSLISTVCRLLKQFLFNSSVRLVLLWTDTTGEHMACWWSMMSRAVNHLPMSSDGYMRLSRTVM